jgi:hypothetical protein
VAEAASVLAAICQAASDEEASKRVSALHDTYSTPPGEPTTGLPTLEGLLGQTAAKALARLLPCEPPSEASQNAEVKPGRRSQASRLVDLVVGSGAELFHAEANPGEAYAQVELDGALATLPLRSKQFRLWLGLLYHRAEGNTVGQQALRDALQTLSGIAAYEGPEHPIYTRVAPYGDHVYLDLANPAWEAVEVTADGWRVVSRPPVHFTRSLAMLELPHPVPGGTVDELRPFVNVGSDRDFRLLVVWLLACLYPRGPYPVLALFAEQGSGKSTTARVLRSLIDPSVALIRAEPKEPKDLIISASKSLMSVYDNLSHLPTWMSDALCRLSTGGGFAVRELYSDDEEHIWDLTRPVLINGIEEIVTRSDLLDRCLVLSLPPILDGRKEESEMQSAFEAARPRILGALLTALSSALKYRSSVRLDWRPRMADFARLATAAEVGLGWEPGTFRAAYQGNREHSNEVALDASPITTPLLRLLDNAQNNQWYGSATDLLAALSQIAGDEATRQRCWPQSARALSGALKRLAPNLRAVGVHVETLREPGGNRARRLSLRRVESACVPCVPDVPQDGVASEPYTAGAASRRGCGPAQRPVRDAGSLVRDVAACSGDATPDARDARDELSPQTAPRWSAMDELAPRRDSLLNRARTLGFPVLKDGRNFVIAAPGEDSWARALGIRSLEQLAEVDRALTSHTAGTSQ